MGKGIIDYLDRYYLGARITSDGRVVGALSQDGVVPGRAAKNIFWGTGHTVGTPCQWYVINMGARLHENVM